MVHLNDIDLAFAGQVLFDQLAWHIKPGQRIGLVGPNGAGKTTLLRMVAGQQEADAGTVARAATTTVGYLEQDVQEADADRTVLDEAMQAFAHILNLEQRIETITTELGHHPDHSSKAYQKLLRQLEEAQAELATYDAYRIQSDTEAVLSGLGFEADEMQRPLHTFSGGWRMRVVLAKMLLQKPDLLLLDEPTNHLDIESIDWLETYLKDYEGTVVLVSHDRYFLDRMVTTTAELAQGKITVYAGNYAFYLQERQERRAMQQAAYDNQQRYIKETERFITRFRAKATKARQVQSRVKALEKLVRLLPPPTEEATIHFRFPEPPRSGRVVLDLSTYSKTYTQDDGTTTQVFKNARPLKIERGHKIALIGKNGAGKSTLARILRGTEPFDGTREIGYQVEMAYFAQHQAESLDRRQTILETLSADARGQTETQIRSLLGAFLFRGDDVYKPIGVLSGGERSRVALARTLLSPANFLILDEPTNHLDMQSKAVLIEALKQYSGTFVIVSHDRHFLDQVVNHVWYVADQDTRPFIGPYADFHWAMHRNGESVSLEKTTRSVADKPAAKVVKKSGGKKTKAQKRLEAEERNRRYRAGKDAKKDALKGTVGGWEGISAYQLQEMIAVLEGEIVTKEEEKKHLEAQLADPAFYNDAAKSTAAIQTFSALEATLKDLYTRWEAAAQHLEEAEANAGGGT